MDDYCFIILRYVNDDSANLYWSHCYDQIRKFYKNEKIIIIDDNSKNKIKKIGNPLDINTILINSEFPGRGELLPYYYFYKNRYAKRAVILHDTVFIHKKIKKYLIFTYKYYFLWHFRHEFNDDETILSVIEKFNDGDNLKKFYKRKKKWKGCFGAMTIINQDYLTFVFNKSNYLQILLQEITTRPKRMAYERIISILLTYYDINKVSINGDIHEDLVWGIDYETYMKKKKKKNGKNMGW